MNILSLTPNIGVNDIRETIQFYQDFLEFTPVVTVPDQAPYVWAMLVNGETTLMLQEKKSIIDEYPLLQDRNLTAIQTFYLKVKNITPLYDKVKNTPHLIKEEHITPYGAKEFALIDNNGNILTIAEADEQE